MHCKSYFKYSVIFIRNKSFNSTEWLERRKKDVYVERARIENYRCRSAFKLLEIDDKYNLLKPGYSVLDIGAAPGSWSQVLADRTNSNGKDKNNPKGFVIAIDKLYFNTIEGVVSFSNKDFTEEASQKKILEVLQSKKLDFVVSDMAPKATGVKPLDQENILNLLYPVLVFSVRNLKVGGGLLVKFWTGRHQEFGKKMTPFFEYFNFVKPKSSYDNSSEIYLLGRNFIGLKKS